MRYTNLLTYLLTYVTEDWRCFYKERDSKHPTEEFQGLRQHYREAL